MTSVRLLRRHDIRWVSQTMAAAFHDDPWMEWLFPDETARPALAGAWMRGAAEVDPNQRGGGQGTKLLARVVDICDAEAIPAYLESSNVRNVSLYERHGSCMIGEAAIPDGPTMRAMWREPRT